VLTRHLQHLQVTSTAAGALPTAAATGTLFGADQQSEPKLQVDDDVHAAAADAAAKWQQRVNHIFGSVGIDTRRRASALFGTAVPGISHQLLADVAGANCSALDAGASSMICTHISPADPEIFLISFSSGSEMLGFFACRMCTCHTQSA
jgi:hypothetical protein